MSSVRPERIAAAARALGGELSERVALYADAIATALATELMLVAWDREQLIGALQVRLGRLRQERFREYGGVPVRIVERRLQPLESIDLAWRHLRQGRHVHVQHEPGACSAGIELLAGLAHALEGMLDASVLTVASEPSPTEPWRSSGSSAWHSQVDVDASDPGRWPLVGVAPPGPRVAIVDEHADRELSAYVLARTCLRRTGRDPRGVKTAYVVGPVDLLQRHLRRLWVGASMGPATAHGSFAGPVEPEVRDRFLEAHARWSSHANVETWCPGGVLERAGDRAIYLAPALFAVDWPVPELELSGPMLVVVRCTPEQARAGAESAVRREGQLIVVGGRPGAFEGDARYIRGALLVERLPPGLPEPRPV